MSPSVCGPSSCCVQKCLRILLQPVFGLMGLFLLRHDLLSCLLRLSPFHNPLPVSSSLFGPPCCELLFGYIFSFGRIGRLHGTGHRRAVLLVFGRLCRTGKFEIMRCSGPVFSPVRKRTVVGCNKRTGPEFYTQNGPIIP